MRIPACARDVASTAACPRCPSCTRSRRSTSISATRSAQIAQRADRAAGRRDRRAGGVSARPARAAGRAGHPRAPVRARARRDRHRDPDAQHGGRGDRQGLRLDGADPDDPGARHAADQAVRLRRAQAARFLPRCATGEWSPAFALSEPEAGSDPGGMRSARGPRRRRVGDRRDQELDHEPRDRRLLRRASR